MAKKVIEQGQTLLDMATLHCGSAEQAVELVLLNGLDLDEVAAGTELDVPTAIEPEVSKYLADKKALPASALEPSAANAGIDEWTLYYTTGLPADHG